MIWVVLFIIAIISSIIQIILSKVPFVSIKVIEILLLNIFTYSVGVMGLIGFYGHAFMADKIARKIGWKPGSPFQFEVAIMNLALGILGIMCSWFRGYFWLATAIFSIVIFAGCGFGHIREIITKQNKEPYNAGFGIWLQTVILPILILILIIAYLRLK